MMFGKGKSFVDECRESPAKRVSVVQESNSESWSVRSHSDGFSSSLILNLESESDRKPKPLSKLINITKIGPGSQNKKTLLLPIFYRKSGSFNAHKNLLFLEKSPNESISSDSIEENTELKQEIKPEVAKFNKVTSTTYGTMHTLSNIEIEGNQELFAENVKYTYENEIKSSIHEGNLIAYCFKCKKETVTAMQTERLNGFGGIKEMILCCCSNFGSRGKVFVCPMCSEVLMRMN
jgi:hypothetical protein